MFHKLNNSLKSEHSYMSPLSFPPLTTYYFTIWTNGRRHTSEFVGYCRFAETYTAHLWLSFKYVGCFRVSTTLSIFASLQQHHPSSSFFHSTFDKSGVRVVRLYSSQLTNRMKQPNTTQNDCPKRSSDQPFTRQVTYNEQSMMFHKLNNSLKSEHYMSTLSFILLTTYYFTIWTNGRRTS